MDLVAFSSVSSGSDTNPDLTLPMTLEDINLDVAINATRQNTTLIGAY